MSTAAADVFDRSPYEAPSSKLVENSEVFADKLFSAKGRVGVLRYNTRIFQAVILIVVGMVPVLLFSSINEIVAPLAACLGLVAMIAGLAVMVYSSIKRLHDLNRSGWFYLISLIPLVGIVWSLFYALKPGSEESNKYGAKLEASQGDKVMGVIGIAFTFLIAVGSVLDLALD